MVGYCCNLNESNENKNTLTRYFYGALVIKFNTKYVLVVCKKMSHDKKPGKNLLQSNKK